MNDKLLQTCMVIVFTFAFMTNRLAAETANNWQDEINKNPHKVSELISKGTITANQIPNPHWKEDACLTCHTDRASVENLNLKSEDYDQFCNDCHTSLDSHSYIHPTEIKIPSEILSVMGNELRASINRSKGKISCITCHDLTRQCLQRESYHQSVNPSFLRGDSYKSRTEICFQCHLESAYQKLNPHIQIVDGKINKENCGICHQTVENLFDEQLTGTVNFNVTKDYSKMCINCHANRPHPGSGSSFNNSDTTANSHLVQLSHEMKEFLAQQVDKEQVVLPFDPTTDKIYCATCHNPHQEGITNNSSHAMSLENKNGLRSKDICRFCHEI